MDLSEYVLEPVHADEALALYRGRRRVPTASSNSSILLIRPISEHPAPATLQRLGHEYSLAGQLQSAWAARPVALTEHQGRTTLVLEDAGGTPLDTLLGRPMQLGLFLRLAVGLAGALRELHARGIIHKDVKPANALVDTAAGRVWLTGFGIASRLRRERQAPEPPEVIAGTLPYMAPEQTGRMNRSIDSRSDLYALGVTMYQMLTGALPFPAADPMECVHSHIARKALPPCERSTSVPVPISAIIMKLLAKTAEERYQTAGGVERDLRRCLGEWEARGDIDDFPLGQEDTPDRLLIPEKLYGREREIEALLAAFDRVVSQGRPELVLVSGYSGIGKSSVVNDLHKALVPPRGLFASGKFDQYKRDIPYSTLAQAFQGLIRHLLGKSEAELRNWRERFREALGPNGQLMVDLVPELKLIIGEQEPLPELPPQRAQRRFQLLFRRLIGVFARPEHPLAIFLDDLQWLDAATLDLIEDLVTQRDVQHLLLIGAYRDNEVDSGHPLMRKLDAIRRAGAPVHEIVLSPLHREDLGRLIADAIRSDPGSIGELAQLVHDKTGGNPFFAIQFLSALAEEKLLAFDHGTARWAWDVERIHAKGYTDNVVDLMVHKLGRLPAETQMALRKLACLGNVASTAMLSLVQGTSEEQVHQGLWEAVRQELIERLDGSYKFLHDRIHEAAYSLIPEEARPEEHLRIGRLLLLHTPEEKRDETIFEIVNQLNRGAALIASREEREQLAGLDLIAGKRAKASTAYAAALSYLAAGGELLADDRWQKCHELTFALELNRAECEFLTGDLGAAEKRLAELSTSAAGPVEEALVACLGIDLYSARDRSDRAIDVGLQYLRRRGIDWSPHPTDGEARREYERIWSLLGSRTIEQLIELPSMTDSEALATLDVLTRLAPPAQFTDKNLNALAACKAITLSLENGNSDRSRSAYVWLGVVAGNEFGDYQAAARFGQLGYELVEQRGLKRFQATTYFWFGGIVLSWTKPFRACRDLLRRAFAVANEIGDPAVAVYSSSMLVSNLLASGDPLADVQREAGLNLEFARNARFAFMVDTATAHLGLVRTLRGLTRTFGQFNDGEVDEQQFERHLSSGAGHALAACWWWIRKLQARFFAGDHAAALDAAANADKLLWAQPTEFARSEHGFFTALSHAASCAPTKAGERERHLEAMAGRHRQLQILAKHCPENFAHRAALVGAEIARLEARPLEAMELYEQALRSAKANGFVHDEALANELAARFYADRGLTSIAQNNLRNARYGYLRWGADGKVRQLEQAHPHLREEATTSGQAASIGAPLDQLDLATVVKVSEAVSGQIVLEKLIEALLRTAVELAGAERGLLILPRSGELSIEAEARTDGERVTVRLGQAPVSSTSEFPESVVRYAARTQQSVILDDASAAGPFPADEYIRRGQIRSALCLPLVKQDRLVALLYLENSLARNVFTPARTAVLRVLASQAAIALENGRLYRELQERESKIRRLVDANIVGVLISDLEGQILEANDAFLNMVGLARGDLESGRVKWTELTPPEWRPASERAVAQLRATGRSEIFEKEYFRKDGSRVPALVAIAAIEGNPLQAVAFIVDLTERKRAEAERATFKGWVEGYPGLMVTMNAAGQVELFSREVLNYFGKTKEELRNWAMTDAVHPDDLPRVIDAWRRDIPAGNDYIIEHRCRRADGVYRWFLVRASPVRDKDSRITGWYVVLTDIDEIKRAQEVIRTSERSLALTIDTIPGLVWSANNDGGADFLNQHYLDFVGLTAHQAQDWDWTAAVHPDDLKHLIADWQRVMASGLPGESEARLRRHDGTYRWFLFRANPLRDDKGKIVKWYGINTDIEDRKQAEADRRAKEVAEMANRAKDQFMANVSHEIRTPMNAILGMTELALEEAVGPEQRLSLSTVKSAAENLLVIIDDLLDFAKIEAGKVELAKEPFSLRQVVRDCVRALAVRAHRKGLDLICDVAAEVPDPMEGDSVRLRQVLVNLVGNAIKFTERGEIALTVALAAPGVSFSVRDTGIGIARDKQRAIFEAFEQADGATARRYGGTGLGLSIATRLAQMMGGKIDVESEPGLGSTFSFTAQLAMRQPLVANPPPAALAGVRVLVADDNRSTCEVLERWLRRWGMDPKVVSGASQALASLREERFALAVIDAGMDGLTPVAGTRVVYLGAIELPETQARLRELGGDARVTKPAMPEELQAALLVALRGGVETTAAPAPAPLIVGRPLRILVAEDNDLNQLLMKQLLATRGHDVTIAADGRKALAQLESSSFDVLLLDVRLPDLDGFEVVKAIREREHETGRHLYVVATTARARATDRESCLAAGMDGFLPKPISAAALWGVLDRVAKVVSSPPESLGEQTPRSDVLTS